MNNFKESELTINYRHELGDLIHASRTWGGKSMDRNQPNICYTYDCLRRSPYILGILLVGDLISINWYTRIFNLLPTCVVIALIKYRFEPKYKEKHQLTLSEKHLYLRTETIKSIIKWTHYSKYFETSKAFILVYGKMMYAIIPKRAINNKDQLNFLRDLLDRVVSHG